jgi:hypothetical protein
MMNGTKKSDLAIVAMKLTNKAGGTTAAESVERRAGAEGNANQQSTHRTQCRARVSQALVRVREVAQGPVGPRNDSTSHTQGGSRVREWRLLGSVRGVRSNAHSYRERYWPKAARRHAAISRPSSEATG